MRLRGHRKLPRGGQKQPRLKCCAGLAGSGVSFFFCLEQLSMERQGWGGVAVGVASEAGVPFSQDTGVAGSASAQVDSDCKTGEIAGQTVTKG